MGLAIDSALLQRMTAFRVVKPIGPDSLLLANLMTDQIDDRALVNSARIGLPDDAHRVTGLDSNRVTAKPHQHHKSS